MFQLFPEFNDFQQLSIFDKVYQLQLSSHCFAHESAYNLLEQFKLKIPELMEFEKEADKLLENGGIKNKQFKVIQETSRIVREKIDNKLEVIFDRNPVTFDFFIQSPLLKDLWA